MYPFRNTYRKSEKVYVEERDVLWELKEGDEGFAEVHAKFKDMLRVGQSAVKSSEEGLWEVVDGFPAEDVLKESRAGSLRSLRDSLLASTDYLMMSDYPLDAEARESLAFYRQSLRDLPQQEGWPMEVEFPRNPLDPK